jgi:hypothetical protein
MTADRDLAARLDAIHAICDEYLDRPAMPDHCEEGRDDAELSYCHDDARRGVADRIRRVLTSQGGEAA